jgi:Co/Zn/Cd efflux system component
MSEACCNHETKTCAGPAPLVLPAKSRDHDHGHDHSHSDHSHAHQDTAVSCCSAGVPVFDGMDVTYKRVLWTVIGINGAMFLTETVAGSLAGSQALKADALDFLADTVTYGLSLAVIGASLRTRATAALFKGLSLSLMAFWVFGSTIYQTLVLGVPSAEVMGLVGFLALAANLASVGLLAPYKDGDANVRSVWLCSRNDAIGNVVVMAAAVGVWGTSSAWPDLAVAALMAGIFLTSSVQILRQAWAEYGADGHNAVPAE